MMNRSIRNAALMLVALAIVSSTSIYETDEEIDNGMSVYQKYGLLGRPMVTFNSGKERIADACRPEDGVCTNFTLCTLSSIKTHPNGVVIAGHDNYLCLEMQEICCTPDPAIIEEKRLQEEKERKKSEEARKKHVN